MPPDEPSNPSNPNVSSDPTPEGVGEAQADPQGQEPAQVDPASQDESQADAPPASPDAAQDGQDDDAPATLALAALLKPNANIQGAPPQPDNHDDHQAEANAGADANAAEQPAAGNIEIHAELPGEAQGLVLKEPPMVVVVQLSGPEDGAGTLIRFGQGVIGRHTEGISVELPHDQWVSRRHAQLTYRGGKWHIEDLGSSNGTWRGSDNTRIREAEVIEIGEIFRVGHTDLMLSSDLSLADQPPTRYT